MAMQCFVIRVAQQIFGTLVSSNREPLSDNLKPLDSVTPGNSKICTITARRPVEGAATEDEPAGAWVRMSR